MEKIKELIKLLLADFELENEEEIFANLTLAQENPKEYLKENQMKMMVYQFIFQDKVLIGMLNRLAELALRILNVLVDLTWRQQKLRLRILSLK